MGKHTCKHVDTQHTTQNEKVFYLVISINQNISNVTNKHFDIVSYIVKITVYFSDIKFPVLGSHRRPVATSLSSHIHTCKAAFGF